MIHVLAARTRIRDLEEGEEEDIREEVVRLGKAYGLASRYTSFVPVEKKESNPKLFSLRSSTDVQPIPARDALNSTLDPPNNNNNNKNTTATNSTSSNTTSTQTIVPITKINEKPSLVVDTKSVPIPNSPVTSPTAPSTPSKPGKKVYGPDFLLRFKDVRFLMIDFVLTFIISYTQNYQKDYLQSKSF
jgi:hypothetical protein